MLRFFSFIVINVGFFDFSDNYLYNILNLFIIFFLSGRNRAKLIKDVTG